MPKSRLLSVLLCVWCASAMGRGIANAQSAGPQPSPMPAPITAPKDMPSPGTIHLSVDATDIERHIFNIRETIPVRPGDSIVLLYPQWTPGNHSPTGRVDQVAGLRILANGATLPWVRDPVDVFAFHVN